MNNNFRNIVEIIADQSIGYFEDEFKIDVISKKIFLKNISRINLDYLTSIISIKGHIDSLIAFSYEKKLIDKLFQLFTADIEVAEDEVDGYLEESACEIMNIIIGNSTKKMEISDSLLTLSPPIVLKEAKNLINKKNSEFYNSLISTEFGNMNLFLIIQRNDL